MEKAVFFNRDLSWLSFNERVLLEAADDSVPILERIKFLSIYSSNLDEFYRVRIPVLMALDGLSETSVEEGNYGLARQEINKQLQLFGTVIREQILPQLLAMDINWVYHEPIPDEIAGQVSDLFFNEVLAYTHSIFIDDELSDFFAENNKLYQAVLLKNAEGMEHLQLVNIPSDVLPRLYAIHHEGTQYIVFIDDIMKHHMSYLFPDDHIEGIYNVKITRDAELNIEDASDEHDITKALEKQLAARDFGFATRFLSEPGIPLRSLYRMVYTLKLEKASIVEGGTYHNLKDLIGFPLSGAKYSYPAWPSAKTVLLKERTLFDTILENDILINVPYQPYDQVLRFFNEAANDQAVTEIYTTLYRVASNSRIVSALITAARNGKKVMALVELKARFDEANNIKWAKQMKAAGVKIIYSSVKLKVHAKVALVKRRTGGKSEYLGLLATGNLNESTARFYTDHILLTARQPMLQELEYLFGFLSKNKKAPSAEDQIDFQHLLVAQFNLQQRFIDLIQREIDHAQAGHVAGITLKMNNLEEQILIKKLYEASQAGVKISLIVRGICCLVPGIPGLSENITVKRIVGRYLEHGRIFIFENKGEREIFMGSADWMNRNIYSRIEVCFPVYAVEIKNMILKIINLQFNNDSQESIYLFLKEYEEHLP